VRTIKVLRRSRNSKVLGFEGKGYSREKMKKLKMRRS
jgi:hypothetical protein